MEEQVGEPKSRLYCGKCFDKGSGKCYNYTEKQRTGRLDSLVQEMTLELGLKKRVVL